MVCGAFFPDGRDNRLHILVVDHHLNADLGQQIDGRLKDAASPFNVAGLTLAAGNDPPQPYRTLIPLMDGVREILSADRNKE